MKMMMLLYILSPPPHPRHVSAKQIFFHKFGSLPCVDFGELWYA
jgi:hypothetical protein